MSNNAKYIWLAALIALLLYLWKTGQLLRLANYIRETRAELERCTWPTWNELKGSTVVVMIAILIVGTFTYVVDVVFFKASHLILSWLT